MKRWLFFAVMVVGGLLVVASCGSHGGKESGEKDGDMHARADTGHARITFAEYTHDFGRLKEGEVVTYTFHFTNTGTADLLITSVSASCGCTIPRYSKKPVRPGGAGEIEIEFNSRGKHGAQRKSIAVRGNTSPPVTILIITAQVDPSENP